jgi:hypothetical protein
MNFIKMQIRFGSFMALFLAVGLILAQPSFTQAQETNEEEAEENDPWADKDFPFEDEILLTFFDANQEVSAVNRESNDKMQETVESFDLTYERFQQIFRASQMGALQNGVFSSEEIESFNAAAPQVTSIQRETQNKVRMIVEEYDMGMQEYRSIMMEFRRDRELQQYVSHLARERAKEKILEERRREAERKMEEERMQREEGNN